MGYMVSIASRHCKRSRSHYKHNNSTKSINNMGDSDSRRSCG